MRHHRGRHDCDHKETKTPPRAERWAAGLMTALECGSRLGSSSVGASPITPRGCATVLWPLDPQHRGGAHWHNVADGASISGTRTPTQNCRKALSARLTHLAGTQRVLGDCSRLGPGQASACCLGTLSAPSSRPTAVKWRAGRGGRGCGMGCQGFIADKFKNLYAIGRMHMVRPCDGTSLA